MENRTWNLYNLYTGAPKNLCNLCVTWGGLNPPTAKCLFLSALAGLCTSPLRLPCLSSALNLGSNPATSVLCGYRGGEGRAAPPAAQDGVLNAPASKSGLWSTGRAQTLWKTPGLQPAGPPGTPRPGWGSGGSPGGLPRCRYRSPGSWGHLPSRYRYSASPPLRPDTWYVRRRVRLGNHGDGAAQPTTAGGERRGPCRRARGRCA